MTALFGWLSQALAAHSALGLAAAFLWGLASVALSPCHLASIPLAVGFLRRDTQSTALGASLAVALGMLASIAGIGGLTLAAGRIAGDLWGLGPWLAVAALMLAGLYLLDVVGVPSFISLHPERIPKNTKGAVLLGTLLGMTLGPCTFAFFAPVFAVVFASSATGAIPTLTTSIGLLGAFVIGHLGAVTAAGLLGLKVRVLLDRGYLATARFRVFAGIALIASAVYVVVTTP